VANLHVQPDVVTPESPVLGTLLLVSADAQTDEDREAAGLTPRRDYRLLAQALGAGICDYGSVRGNRLGRLASSIIGRGPTHAFAALLRGRKYRVLFSDNEYAGLFLGVMLRCMPKRPFHVLLAHHLTPRKKRLPAKLARPGIDSLIVHSDAQRNVARSVLGFSSDAVTVLPYQVDTDFWRPLPHSKCPDLICTAGLECRDYDTLLTAISGLEVDVRIGAASNWSRKRNSLHGRKLPGRVAVRTYDYVSLRELYASSAFVVVPLLEVDFQAGVTTILEGMAMGKAVIATRTSGQRDVVLGPTWMADSTDWPHDGPPVDVSTGIYTLPDDSAGLRSAIRFLLARPDVADRLGCNGRRRVEAEFRVEQFASRFANAISAAVPNDSAAPRLHISQTPGI